MSIDLLIDRILSRSSSSPERLGTRRSALGTAVRAVLEPFVVNGAVTEVVEARAEVFSG